VVTGDRENGCWVMLIGLVELWVILVGFTEVVDDIAEMVEE
jgi:hypothetical protein